MSRSQNTRSLEKQVQKKSEKKDAGLQSGPYPKSCHRMRAIL